MATVEELLETLISVQEETQSIEETQSSDIQTLTSQNITITSELQSLTSDMEVLKLQNLELSSGYVDETTPNYLNQNLLNIFNAQGGYLKEETLANNTAYYKAVVEQNELMTFQLILLGVFIAFFIVLLVVKGFFKHVSS